MPNEMHTLVTAAIDALYPSTDDGARPPHLAKRLLRVAWKAAPWVLPALRLVGRTRKTTLLATFAAGMAAGAVGVGVLEGLRPGTLERAARKVREAMSDGEGEPAARLVTSTH